MQSRVELIKGEVVSFLDELHNGWSTEDIRDRVQDALKKNNIAKACYLIGGYFSSQLRTDVLVLTWYQKSIELGYVKAIPAARSRLKNLSGTKELFHSLIDCQHEVFKKKKNYSDFRSLVADFGALTTKEDKKSEPYQASLKKIADAYATFPRGIFSKIELAEVKSICTSLDQTPFIETAIVFGNILLHRDRDQTSIDLAKTNLKRIANQPLEQESKERKISAAHVASLMLCDHSCETFLSSRFTVLSFDLFEHMREATHLMDLDQKEIEVAPYSKSITKLMTERLKLTADQHKKYKQAVKSYHEGRCVQAATEFAELAKEIQKSDDVVVKMFAAHCYRYAGDAYLKSDRSRDAAITDARNCYLDSYHLLRNNDVNAVRPLQLLSKLPVTSETYEAQVKALSKCFIRETTARYHKNFDDLSGSLTALAKNDYSQHKNFEEAWIESAYDLAQTCIKTKSAEIKKAIIDLLKTVETTISSTKVKIALHQNLTECYQSAGENCVKEAAQHAREVFKLSTDFKEKYLTALIQAGDTLSQQNKPSEAEIFFKEAKEQKDIRGVIGFAKTERLQGKADSAATHLQHAIQSLIATPDEKNIEKVLQEASHLCVEVTPSELDGKIGNHVVQLFESLVKDSKENDQKNTPKHVRTLFDYTKKWLKNEVRKPVSETNFIKILTCINQCRFQKDRELLELMGKAAVDRRDYNFAANCYLQIIDAPGLSLHEKQKLLSTLPDHARHESWIVQREADLKFAQDQLANPDGLSVLLAKESKEHPPQVYFDAVDEWIEKFAHAENMENAKSKNLFTDIANKIIANNVLAKYARDKLNAKWKKQATFLSFSLMLSLSQVYDAVCKKLEKGSFEDQFQVILVSKLLLRSASVSINDSFVFGSLFNRNLQDLLPVNFSVSHVRNILEKMLLTFYEARKQEWTAINHREKVSRIKEISSNQFSKLCNEARLDNLSAMIEVARQVKNHHPLIAICCYIKFLVLTSLADPKNEDENFNRYHREDILTERSEAAEYLSSQRMNHPLAAWGLEFIGTPTVGSKEKTAMIATLLKNDPDLNSDMIVTAALQSKKLGRTALMSTLKELTIVCASLSPQATQKIEKISVEIDQLTPDPKPDVRSASSMSLVPMAGHGARLFSASASTSLSDSKYAELNFVAKHG